MFEFDAQTMSDRIVYVPVEWIMKNLAGSADRCVYQDEDYFDGSYTEDQNDRMIMDLVKYKKNACAPHIETIGREGFRVPIVINVCKWTGEFSLGNGHHRFTSAILMVLPEIPVLFATDNDWIHSDVSEGEELEWNKDTRAIQSLLKCVSW